MFATTHKEDELKIALPVRYSQLKPGPKRAIREQYIKVQGGRCCYCNGRFDEDPPEGIASKKVTPKLYPKGFFIHPIHLHHSHVTDMTIGAVHAWCNAVLFEHHGE